MPPIPLRRRVEKSAQAVSRPNSTLGRPVPQPEWPHAESPPAVPFAVSPSTNPQENTPGQRPCIESKYSKRCPFLDPARTPAESTTGGETLTSQFIVTVGEFDPMLRTTRPNYVIVEATVGTQQIFGWGAASAARAVSSTRGRFQSQGERRPAATSRRHPTPLHMHHPRYQPVVTHHSDASQSPPSPS